MGGVDDPVGSHFKRWLRHGTGCGFAAQLAHSGRAAFETHLATPDAGAVDQRLDEYARSERVAILIFPLVTDEQSLVSVLCALRDGSSRWKLRDRGPTPNDRARVGVDWVTATGDLNETMGFAPLLSMPITRRAPYAAIAAWPGGRSNPLRGVPPTPRAKPGRVSFLDAKYACADDAYPAVWARTMDAVGDLMSVPPDRASHYYDVTFVLGNEHSRELTFDP